MKHIVAICCIVLLITGCWGKTPSIDNKQWTFHTTPDKWNESRVFHSPFDDKWADRIIIKRIPAIEIKSEKIFSPNKAYWFSIIDPNYSKSMTRNVQIDIFNERDYHISLQLMEIGNYVLQTKWVNEKLLYVRTWWGRVLGFDLLFDVEKEQIIYKEFVNDGGIPFMQWQQAKIEE
jgi:hypothetical protein